MNRDILIAQIMNNAPHQLPPVIHGNGVYSLDIEYAGQKFCKVGITMEEVLEAYFRWVTKIAWISGNGKESISQVPIRPGAKIEYRKNQKV